MARAARGERHVPPSGSIPGGDAPLADRAAVPLSARRHSLCASAAPAQAVADATLERVTITGSGQPTSLPTQIPATMESITREQIERTINATDSEDALKYLPSLLVRKRYIGDYDHAILSTRASGTGNSARSLVYADGILLSNLLGNGAGFTPRWGLVTPEEIERVDVLYGPFSAAYSGNSAGAIVDYVTRMPSRLEAHVKLQGFTQRYDLYQTDARFSGHQESASIGSREGGLAWWLNLNRLDSNAQPITYSSSKNRSRRRPARAASRPVSGAGPRSQSEGSSGVVLGTGTDKTRALEEHAKLKLAYDVTPTLRASYTLGYWSNDADRGVDSFLRDAPATL